MAGAMTMGRLALATVALCALATHARAQPAAPDDAAAAPAAGTKDPKLAKRWATAGAQLIAKGDALAKSGHADDAKAQYANAVIAYTNALAAGADIAVTLDLTLALEKAGQAADAYKQLQQLVAASGVPPAVAKKAQAKLDDLGAKLGTVTLKIQPEGAQIAIAGAVVGTAPLAAPLVLAPGVYAVSLTAPGYQPKDVELKVEAGSESERKLALEPVPVTAPNHVITPEPTVAAAPAPHGPILPLELGGGAVLAFTATATITGIAAITQHHAFTDPTYSAAQRAHAQSTGRLEAHLTDGFLGGAALAAAFTVAWYVVKYRHPSDAGPEAGTESKVGVIPWVQPDAGGVVVARSF